MTTKAPATVQEFPTTSIERIAYASVAEIPTEEPNDRHRLGYHVWRWLEEKQGTLEEAVQASSARMKVSHAEALKIIRENLTKSGITA